MRTLALGGVVGPAIFVSITVICAALRPGYSHMHNLISELGVRGTPLAGLMNYGGFVPGGLLLAALGVSLRNGMPSSRLGKIGAFLISVFGLGVALSGVFSCDSGCPQSGGSLENLIHDRIAPLTFASGSLGAMAIGLGFRRISTFRSLWFYSLVSGVLGLCFLAAVASSLERRQFVGVWQRLLLGVLFCWCAVTGLRLFRSESAHRPPA